MWRPTISFGVWWLDLYKHDLHIAAKQWERMKQRPPTLACLKLLRWGPHSCCSDGSEEGFWVMVALFLSLPYLGILRCKAKLAALTYFIQEFIYTLTQVLECKWKEGADSGWVNINKYFHYSCKIIISFQIIRIGIQKHMLKSPWLYKT